MNSQHETGPGITSSDVAIPSRSPDATKPSRKNGRSLSRQVALLLIGLTLALAALSFATQALVVLPAFADLENEAARRDVRLCMGALNRDIELISNLTNDWSAWDDTYRYIQGKYASFEEVNLIDESFSNGGAIFFL